MQGILSIQSHVVYGHAGNSSAVFPLQRMGFEVWPIHTVQFSNHTEYTQGWQGDSFSAKHIQQLVQGLDNIGQLQHCSAILSGYQATPEQCLSIVDIVKKVKKANPKAIYLCDPVMASNDKCLSLPAQVNQCLISHVLPIADIIVPNQFELSQFVNLPITNLQQVKQACQAALALGPKIVLVKNADCIAKDKFSMILATPSAIYIAQRPMIAFDKAPVGVGDLISAIFLAGLLAGHTPLDAFTHCHNAVYGILKKTSQLEEWELQTIAAQDELIKPSSTFSVHAI